ncbi:MAG TPA: hypothetical protein VMZ28_14665 [Kofleriaceae bacterium]|nr:hypothetical protein [Kofleriaceae bacterium]
MAEERFTVVLGAELLARVRRAALDRNCDVATIVTEALSLYVTGGERASVVGAMDAVLEEHAGLLERLGR